MYQWSGAYKFVQSNGQVMYTSCVAIAPTLVIGPAHGTPTPTGTSKITEVVFGSNYNTSNFRMAVSSYERYPGYVFGDTNTIDLAVFHLASPIPGFTKPVTFADANIGEMLTMVDYGDYGDLNSGDLASKGDRFAGVAPVTTSLISPYPSNFYATTLFEQDAFSDPTLGLPNSSGSGWYNAEGDLTLLSTAATNGVSDGREGYSLRLNSEVVQSYLQPLIQESWASSVPEPTTLTLFGAASMGLLARRHRRDQSGHDLRRER
jgi:hypothetical protein